MSVFDSYALPEPFRKWGGVLLAIAVSVGVFSAWASSGSINTTEEPAAEEAVVAEESEAAEEAESTAYVRAKDDFSNLQLYDVTKPVYDRYTVAQRQAKGLPTALPDLIPYTSEKVAYLTFDDGPDNKNTPAVLDILKQYGAVGTFYVVGTMVEANPEVLKRIFDEGHAIGNHTYSHDYKCLYSSPEAFLAELAHTDDLIYNVLGVRPFIVRAPGGTTGMFTEAFPPALKANGYVEHDWNVSTEDATYKRPTADMETHYVDAGTPPELNSAIVLMHSIGGKEETVKALPGIIQLLKEKGYRFGVVTPMTPAPW